MDENGETATIYVWPANHEDGEPYPEGFWRKLSDALTAGGFEWEVV